MDFRRRFVPMAAAVLAIPAALWSLQPGGDEREALDPAGVQRLIADTGGAARVAIHPATGAARFVRLEPGSEGSLATKRAKAPASFEEESEAFFFEYGSIFGIENPRAELVLEKVASDRQGMTSLTYRQYHRGVPVFAGELKTHFNARKQLSAVNGTFIPAVALNTSPSRSWQDASQVALGKVENDMAVSALGVRGTALLVYRTGLARGIPGQNHLVWEVEVGNGADVREFVYVDAHSGKVVDQITGIYDAMFRRAYDALGQTAPGPNYPGTPFWVEGQAFPTGNLEADNMIYASGETYAMFSQAFSRDSFDGAGGIMDSIFNRGNGCPNASWNGTFISFCPGTTSDDVTAHEWGHAYTQYTHNLIYQWQPGALNEAYSDIWGETVDFINGRQTDSPGGVRSDGACSVFTTLAPKVTINAPAAIAGPKNAGSAAFGPQTFTITNDIVLANDGVVDATPGATTTDGCCAGPSFVCAVNSWPNAAAIAGKFAMVDRGACGFAIKVKNAQNNGALGVIVANNQGGTAVANMAGVDPTITVPSLLVSQNDGAAIKGQLVSTTVNATLSRGATGTDNSYRWLIGEDATAFGGAIRDMWHPNCYGHPGKVSDPVYTCGTGDAGGVHSNSGVPNHGYSLIVDGGTYNGQTVAALGLTKAAHIYFRAMTVYQSEASDFSDHADAIEQSCTDLIGANLADLLTGAPSGQILSAANCVSVVNAALAVELRTPPTQCNFQPLLGQTPPADPACGASTARVNLFTDNFEGSTAGWTISHDAVTPATYNQPDWTVSSTLPDGRAGKAFFGDNPGIGSCTPADDESGVRHLTSPAISLPVGSSGHTVTFEHWVATEAGFDGGQLMISVNGGAFTLVPQANFLYNGYNLTLATAGQGNTNPRAGQRAWSGTDGGAVDGSWGRSIVSLAGLAAAGQTIQLRWDISTDGCGGVFGWYVDDVTVYACLPTANPTISINDVSVTEGNSGTTDATFTVSLSHASTKTITVKHKTNNGTAKSELDYIKNLEKTLTFPPLSGSGSITVKVLGETLVEANETFFVDLSKPTNATIADSQGKGTIQNDD